MCKRAALALAVGAMVAMPLGAQSMAQLAADSARLAVQVAAYARADSIKRVTDERPSADTLRAGIFVIAAPRATHAALKAGAALATAHLRASLGSEADRVAKSLAFQVRVQRVYRGATFGPEYRERFDLYSSGPDAGGIFSLFIGAPVDAALAASALEQSVTEQIAHDMDPAFKTLAGGRLRLERAEPSLWTDLARSMMVTAAVNRRCVNGALDDCERAAGLRETPDALTVWYDETDLPNFFSLLSPQQKTFISTRAGSDALLGCTKGRITECVPLLALVNRAQVAAPMPALGGALLVRTALDMGGEEGLRRLGAARGQPLRVQVETLAGRPLGEVMRVWQRQLVANRPHGGAPAPLVAVAGLAWIALLGALSTRSAPWHA